MSGFAGVPSLDTVESVKRHARGLLDDLGAWAKPAYPQPPVELAQPRELEAIMVAKRLGSVTKAQQEMLNLLGMWRLEVQRAENEALARLMVLLGAIARLDQHAIPAVRLRRFVAVQYGHGKVPKMPLHRLKVEAMATILSTDLRLLPRGLR